MLFDMTLYRYLMEAIPQARSLIHNPRFRTIVFGLDQLYHPVVHKSLLASREVPMTTNVILVSK